MWLVVNRAESRKELKRFVSLKYCLYVSSYHTPFQSSQLKRSRRGAVMAVMAGKPPPCNQTPTPPVCLRVSDQPTQHSMRWLFFFRSPSALVQSLSLPRSSLLSLGPSFSLECTVLYCTCSLSYHRRFSRTVGRSDLFLVWFEGPVAWRGKAPDDEKMLVYSSSLGLGLGLGAAVPSPPPPAA